MQEVEEGQECGIVLDGYADVKEGDVLEFFETKQVEQTLEARMATPRMRRINEVLREVIGAAIAELSDPRIGFVTVTSVETSPDLRAAKVYVSVLGSEEEREATLTGLRSSHGVLQAKIAAETRMKRTPTLTFHYDETIEQGMRITELLEEEETVSDGDRCRATAGDRARSPPSCARASASCSPPTRAPTATRSARCWACTTCSASSARTR